MLYYHPKKSDLILFVDVKSIPEGYSHKDISELFAKREPIPYSDGKTAPFSPTTSSMLWKKYANYRRNQSLAVSVEVPHQLQS